LLATSSDLLSAGKTQVQLAQADTGRRIMCVVLYDGETIVLTWTNSLFRLSVTETYVAHAGILEQTGVAFADPSGREPPTIRPDEVDDFYHTGGPFKTEGMKRPFHRIVFRVGEIGNPVLRIRDQVIRLSGEVGFGGAVIMKASLPSTCADPCGCDDNTEPGSH